MSFTDLHGGFKGRAFTGRRGRGFTLIELLVVVAIIALLVSILLPSLAKARELAQSAVCATHLRGNGSALALYTSENGTYPGLFGHWSQQGTDGYFDDWNMWYGQLEPYIMRMQSGKGAEGETARGILRCPTAGMMRKYWEWSVPYVSYIAALKVFQGPDYWANPESSAFRDAPFVNPDTVDKPSWQIALGESKAGANPGWDRFRIKYDRQWGSNDRIWGYGVIWAEGEPVIHYWHGDSDKTNALFADYHVQTGITWQEGREHHYQDPVNDELADPEGWEPPTDN